MTTVVDYWVKVSNPSYNVTLLGFPSLPYTDMKPFPVRAPVTFTRNNNSFRSPGRTLTAVFPCRRASFTTLHLISVRKDSSVLLSKRLFIRQTELFKGMNHSNLSSFCRNHVYLFEQVSPCLLVLHRVRPGHSKGGGMKIFFVGVFSNSGSTQVIVWFVIFG